MESISVFLDITKVANFCIKKADVSTIQGVCHMIYMPFGFIAVLSFIIVGYE